MSRPTLRRLAALALLAALPVLAGCGDDGGTRRGASHGAGGAGHAGGPDVGPAGLARVRDALSRCTDCHTRVGEEYLGHGMAHSLGVLERAPTGSLTHPVTGDVYAFEQLVLPPETGAPPGERTYLRATRPDGGERLQLVVGHYGAGVLDTSYIGSELDRVGRPTGRLSFLPVESVRGHGLALSPFDESTPGTGFDMPFARECLRCHTLDDPRELPAVAPGVQDGHLWPAERLGLDAFAQLRPLECDTCHGAEVERHAELKEQSLERGERTELGLQRLGQLDAAAQRDICARCHLQGEGQVDLGEVGAGGPAPDDLLLQRPVVVAAEPGDDFRFVGQLQRLALSACFQGAPDTLTCTSCHEPHQAVAAQGTASFDARCLACHDGGSADASGAHATCSRPGDLRVEDVTGEAARTADGCVDCHVRRSEPFDLSHVRTADHFVRRRIPPPASVPLRGWDTTTGPLRVFDDGRFASRLATPEGRRWERGVVALSMPSMGRHAEAVEALADFTAPGTVAAAVEAAGDAGRPAGTIDTAEGPLPNPEAHAVFHHVRALALEGVGDTAGARAAYSDALALDPAHPQARLNRASLALAAGDLAAARADANLLQERYPFAEKAWNLRARVASLEGNTMGAAACLGASTEAWPSDAVTWQLLGRLLLELQQARPALDALRRAQSLDPSRPGLGELLQRAEAAARGG